MSQAEAIHDSTELPTDNQVTDSDLKRIIGKWYDNASEMSGPVAERAYSVLAQVNAHWYDMIPVEVIWQDEDPYSCYSDMKQTVAEEGLLRVFDGGSNPDFMSHEDNIKGRAVHDWYGHLERDCDFSLQGEWMKYNHVKHRYPSWVRPLLFTEIVGQRAAASYYPDGFTDDRFTQKHSFAPCHIMDMARTKYGDSP